MLDWNNYRSELMQRLGELGKLTPETMKGVVALGTQVTKLTFWAQKCVNSLPWRAQSQPAATAVLLFTPTPL
ncbi:Uncharacterised protein [Kluyvera cryocrescens]|uniref:Carboxymuconolactone decarboxylase family protein n=1 Tax=Kluyvera cryocrescens TaxID=580 RepID=A0A485CBC1_KLUCR|nr:Uncharacterised protein [Kluyvera cryocrescens]